MAVDASWVRARGGALQGYSEFSTAPAGAFGESRTALALGYRPLSLLLAAVFVLALAVFNGYAIQQLHSGNVGTIAEENGLLENIQLLVTLAT